MRPADRTRALNAAWVQLWWLADPAHSRWVKTLEVLADSRSRLTIEQGSGENLGRRSPGTVADPTFATAAGAIDAGLDGTRETRRLRAIETDIAETAAFIRSTISGQPVGTSSIIGAIHDIAWCCEIPHTSAAWTTDDDELRREVDHAHEHLAREASVLAGRCRTTLAAAVREKPKVEQPKRQNCASCRRFGLDVDVDSRGMCTRCLSFRKNHKVMPTEAICRVWANGSERITPGLIAEAKAARRSRRKAG